VGTSEVWCVGEVVEVGSWAEMEVSGSREHEREEVGVVGAEDCVCPEGCGGESGCG
jgi:hypothetical protein